MKQEMLIRIGEFYASRSPCIIHTILGSCVAVCLFDPVLRIGGMNHIFLPGRAVVHRANEPARYGVNAMEMLINRMLWLGAKKERLTAKVFGGGHLLPCITMDNGVGPKIAGFVFRFLERERIRVLSHDLGGTDGRKVLYHTDTGDVYLKRISPFSGDQYEKAEKRRMRFLQQKMKKPGKITMFRNHFLP